MNLFSLVLYKWLALGVVAYYKDFLGLPLCPPSSTNADSGNIPAAPPPVALQTSLTHTFFGTPVRLLSALTHFAPRVLASLVLKILIQNFSTILVTQQCLVH